MADLIYWLGQIVLVELELIGMVVILVLPALWIIGAIFELIHKIRIDKFTYIFTKGKK